MPNFDSYVRPDENSASSGAPKPDSDSTADKLWREASAITSAAFSGAKDESQSQPLDPIATLAISSGFGYAMATASRRFGAFSHATGALGVASISSLTRAGLSALENSSDAISAIWNSPDNLDANKSVLAKNFGPLALNFAMATGGGIIGARVGRFYVPRLDNPTLPGSSLTFRRGTAEDYHQVRQVGRVTAQPFNPGARDNRPFYVLEYPNRGVVGFGLMSPAERQFNAVAVLPEYRKYSLSMLQPMFKQMREYPGEWTAWCKESTSLKLVKMLEQRGQITVRRDLIPPVDAGVKDPYHEVTFTVHQQRLPRGRAK